MEPMHIELLIIDKESLAHCDIAVIVCLEVELDLIWQKLAFIGSDHLALVCEDRTTVPVLFLLKLLHYFLRCQST